MSQVSSLSQHVAELEGQLGRADRDKSSLTKQLEDTLGKLTNLELDSTKVHLTSVQKDPLYTVCMCYSLF